MTGERLNRFSEFGKTVLIFLLTTVMLVLFLLLMLGQNENGDNALVFENRLLVYETGAAVPVSYGMATERVVPRTLLWREAGEDTAQAAVTRTTLRRGYAALYPLIREVFGADSICTALDAEAGRELWESCRRSDTFLYCVYPGELPAAVIRMYTYAVQEEGTAQTMFSETAQGDHAYVRELFICEDADGLFAVSRDQSGGVSVFRPSPRPDEEVAHLSALSAYIETVGSLVSGSAPVSFIADAVPGGISSKTDTTENGGGAEYVFRGSFSRGTDTALLWDTIFMPENISIRRFDAEVMLSGEKEALLYPLLTTAGMREDEFDNYYYDKDGARVYLNADGKLNIGADGVIRYAALERGGLGVSSFLGYTNINGSYTLSEYLQVADRVLGQLLAENPVLCGNSTGNGESGDCALTSVEAVGDDGIRVRYVYTCGGLPLLRADGSPCRAFEITIADGAVKGFTMYLLSLRTEANAVCLLPQAVTLRAMAYEQEEHGEDDAPGEEQPDEIPEQTVAPEDPVCGTMFLGYVIPDGGGRTAVSAEWIFSAEPAETDA